MAFSKAQLTSKFSVVAVLAALSGPAYGIFIDGKGHYSILGETRTHPGFDAGSGLFQAARQNFRLEAEIRANDRSSFFAELSLFDNPRRAYLGDTVEPRNCSNITQKDDLTTLSKSGNAPSCSGRHQNSGEPSYKPLTPKITEAYAQYAFDSCLLTAGRRSRSWGMGIYLNAGKGPFDTESSVFDGVSCDINIQKTQTLAFKIGYDKLAETGTAIDESTDGSRTYGATNPSDDLDQYFFTIEYDDRKANAGTDFSQQVGFYFANIIGSGDLKTDIKIADLYLSFYMPNLIVRQEVIFRLGKSADPSWARLGGVHSRDGSDDAPTNKLTSIGAAGSFEYFVSRSGSIVGPSEYFEGNAQSHSLFLDYAYAPGDRDGYSDEYVNDERARKLDVTAMAFHRNYKPALLLFNGPAEIDDIRTDGVFDPGRVMNAFVAATGYRYKSLENGNFELRLVYAQLNKSMPGFLKEQVSDLNTRPIGFKGRSLGFELDLKYDRHISQDVYLGIAAALASPGDAWDIKKDQDAVSNYLIQSFIAFKF